MARSQPMPYGDKLLVGSQDGTVYALDLASGCAHWTYKAAVEVRNKKMVKIALEKILSWDAERVILAHGENIEGNVNKTLCTAWKKVLNA